MKYRVMKYIIHVNLLMAVIVCGCTQQKPERVIGVENTIKSITLLSDSIGIEPGMLLQTIEKGNKAIDSLGYPGAGYRLWLIQSDTAKAVRFMIEGSWPSQEVYIAIHDNQSYKNAMKGVEKALSASKIISYNRFSLVK